MLGPMMYGTAWKELDTERCVTDALAAGFVAIDTANQRKHYHEVGVGDALKKAFDKGLRRGDVYLQSKYTSVGGQDHRLPYNPAAPVADQVVQSFESSLIHLHTDYLDSLVLHGPTHREGISEADKQAWRAMEELFEAGRVRAIGVSNVDRRQLDQLTAWAKVTPHSVQHRCYARMGWGALVREWCREQGAVYQGFSLLTANRQELALPQVAAWADSLHLSIPQMVFRFARAVGMWPLTGTTSRAHMEQDLKGCEGDLPDEVVDGLLKISGSLPS